MIADALMEASSSRSASSSLRVSLREVEGLNESARRNLDLILLVEVASWGGESIAARSLSSRDIRFSAVKLPCDSGDGRGTRGAGEGFEGAFDVLVVLLEVLLEVVVEVVGADDDVELLPDGRAVVAVAVDEADDVDGVRP